MNYQVIRIANPDCKRCRNYFFSSLSFGNECRRIPIPIKDGACTAYDPKSDEEIAQEEKEREEHWKFMQELREEWAREREERRANSRLWKLVRKFKRPSNK